MKILKKISLVLGLLLAISTLIFCMVYQFANPDFTQARIFLNIGIYYIPAIIIAILLTAFGFKND